VTPPNTLAGRSFGGRTGCASRRTSRTSPMSCLPAAGKAPPSRSQPADSFCPNVSAAYVSGSGVQVTVVDYARPIECHAGHRVERPRVQALQKETMTAAIRQRDRPNTRVKLLLFNARRLHQSPSSRNRHAPGRHRSTRGARQA